MKVPVDKSRWFEAFCDRKPSDPLIPFRIPGTRRRNRPIARANTAFVPWIGQGLSDILCIQEERVVGKDNTVRYEGQSLQIPKDQHRYHYVKAKVRVHVYPDGSLAVFHGPRCLVRYQADGNVIEAQNRQSLQSVGR